MSHSPEHKSKGALKLSKTATSFSRKTNYLADIQVKTTEQLLRQSVFEDDFKVKLQKKCRVIDKLKQLTGGHVHSHAPGEDSHGHGKKKKHHDPVSFEAQEERDTYLDIIK